MNIYVASSWRNQHQGSVVAYLRNRGHVVYDFRRPSPGDRGFHWSEIDPEWKTWTTVQYQDGLEHALAQHGFATDFGAMQSAQACVLVLPCGASAHLEAGGFCGRGLPVIVFVWPGERIEPELMYKLATRVVGTFGELDAVFGKPGSSEESRQQSAVSRKKRLRVTSYGCGRKAE